MKDNNFINIILSFDLDNTLINNQEGIVNSFNYALKKYNIPKIEKSKIKAMIGIPLNEMFSKIQSNIDVVKLAQSFREYYASKGIYEATLIKGVLSILKYLKKKRFTMGIITSKQQKMV